MANEVKEIGEIVWVDLTIPNAAKVREFYVAVTGWEADEFKIGEYSDYVIATPDKKQTVAGICHTRGDNASLPPYWLIYIKVRSLEASVDVARRQGGEVIAGPRQSGGARFCVLRDPAGAVFAIIEGESGY